MSKVLSGITGLASVWVIFLGVYNIAAHRGASTGEIQQAQLWVGILALSVGIGLLAMFLQRIRG
ncbi:MAG: hypothetical protein HY683_09650 [Chloroflexi bacterium]|nr:hypothetical protein [Chloroflexota bacterium]